MDGKAISPPMVITKHTVKLSNAKVIKYHVFRDDLLVGGTKQRALPAFIKKLHDQKYNSFIYAGPTEGMAQVALSLSAAIIPETKAVLFINKIRPMAPLTLKAMQFKPEIHEIQGGYLAKLQELAAKYHKDHPSSYLLEFGAANSQYIRLETKAIKKSLPANLQPKRIWLVAGSATLLNILYDIFPPPTKFMVVQVGKTVWPDQLDSARTTLFVSPERFGDTAKKQPPYPTVPWYDAKLWAFFLDHGCDQDYIWNVGSV